MVTDLAGKTALITGAGRGIGRAVALGRFNQNFTEGTLITPGQSAAALIAHLAGDDTGVIWDASTVPIWS